MRVHRKKNQCGDHGVRVLDDPKVSEVLYYYEY